ncbi:MAG: hypothetical protein AAF399_23775 [Bacteroidota bacterium]
MTQIEKNLNVKLHGVPYSKLELRADHTFIADFGINSHSSGTWRVSGKDTLLSSKYTLCCMEGEANYSQNQEADSTIFMLTKIESGGPGLSFLVLSGPQIKDTIWPSRSHKKSEAYTSFHLVDNFTRAVTDSFTYTWSDTIFITYDYRSGRYLFFEDARLSKIKKKLPPPRFRR